MRSSCISGEYYAGLAAKARGTSVPMLRKLLWTAVYGGIGALATVISRRGASTVWRTITGEEPPTKK